MTTLSIRDGKGRSLNTSFLSYGLPVHVGDWIQGLWKICQQWKVSEWPSMNLTLTLQWIPGDSGSSSMYFLLKRCCNWRSLRSPNRCHCAILAGSKQISMKEKGNCEMPYSVASEVLKSWQNRCFSLWETTTYSVPLVISSWNCRSSIR